MPAGGVDHDRVRVADAQLERRALQRGAVADALDLEALLEALRDALDHVRDERAREAVQRAVLAAVGGALHERAARRPSRSTSATGTFCVSSPERAVDRDATRVERDVDARRALRLAVFRFDSLAHQMKQTTSPPTPRSSAVRLVIEAARGGQDRRAHAPEHARQAVLPSVHAAAGLRDALEVGDDPLAVAAVLQLDDERAVGAVLVLVLLCVELVGATTRKSLM